MRGGECLNVPTSGGWGEVRGGGKEMLMWRLVLDKIVLRKISTLIRRMTGGKDGERNFHFRSVPDPVTGQMGWALETDWSMDVARAGYADMLHDSGRNDAYYSAIKSAVKKVQDSGRRAIVLDIGAGTGLLSMMAVSAGADEVYACECFSPMYDTCRRVLARNLVSNKIHLVPKRSTELVIGVDIPQRANILVTETFDTELIGEHCIQTYNHAGRELMEPSYLAVPTSATVYCQLVSSEVLSSFHALNHHKFNSIMSNCPGLPSAFDLQLSKILPTKDFQPITPILPLFNFDFTQPIPTQRSTTLSAKDSSYTTALLFWKLEMDEESTISCFPEYYEKDYQWREHWIQWVHHIPTDLRKDQLTITQNELDYSLDRVDCDCGLHRLLSRSRICTMNKIDLDFYTKLDIGKRVLFIGDDSLIPFALQEKGHEVHLLGEDCLGFQNTLTTTPPDTIISEPHFRTSQSDLNNLQFFSKLSAYPNIPHHPSKARIHMLAVSFHHLHKIRSPVMTSNDFNLTDFDDIIIGCSGNELETHPLWEYDFDVIKQWGLFTVDEFCGKMEEMVEVPEGSNGLVFYVGWEFGNVEVSPIDEFMRFAHGSSQTVAFVKGGRINVKYSLDGGLLLLTPALGVVG